MSAGQQLTLPLPHLPVEDSSFQSFRTHTSAQQSTSLVLSIMKSEGPSQSSTCALSPSMSVLQALSSADADTMFNSEPAVCPGPGVILIFLLESSSSGFLLLLSPAQSIVAMRWIFLAFLPIQSRRMDPSISNRPGACLPCCGPPQHSALHGFLHVERCKLTALEAAHRPLPLCTHHLALAPARTPG